MFSGKLGSAKNVCPVQPVRGVLMAMKDDGSRQLLRQFVETRSDEAFRRLVRQHAPMVFSTALRRLSGDRAAAEDVTQEVFCLLARKASGLTGVVLAGWLYRQACRRAANFVRTEIRRKQRETSAMEESSLTHHLEVADDLARELDAAMDSLAAKDRDALVIRYFESADYSTVGRALGISEEAARKQVSRALEKLSVIFKRKGITVASASLGGSLSGFGAESLPENLVSRISAHAMKATPVAGSAWIYLFKPIAAGVVATSLVSSVILTVRNEAGPPASVSAGSKVRADSVKSRRPEYTVLPEGASLDVLIAEIKRIQAGPANSLTKLRLTAVLDRIRNDQIRDFIGLANVRLNHAERVATYGRLLSRWVAAEPESVMDFVLAENICKQVDQRGSTSLLNILFHDWMWKDARAAGAWLLRHWEDPVLKSSSFREVLRERSAASVVGVLIDADDKAALADFIRALPTDLDRKAAFEQVVGVSSSGDVSRFFEVNKGMACYQFIRSLPNAPWSSEVARSFLSRWMEISPEVFEKAASTMGPDDMFTAALGRLGARHVPGKPEPSLSGGMAVRSQRSDAMTYESSAIRAGLEAGLPREDVLSAVGSVLLHRLPREAMLIWLDAHHDEIQMDGVLADKARMEAFSRVMTEQVPCEVAAIGWASRISEPELRARLCRGAFRKLCAEKPADAAAWMDKPDLPRDLRDTFRTILEETR